MMTLPKKALFMRLILGILVFSQVFVPVMANAASVGSIPFGGVVTGVIPCLCSGNFVILQAPVAGPPTLIYQPGVSRLYQYGQILVPGSHILGTATVPMPCVELIIIFCVPIYTAPMIAMVGTSGLGGLASNLGGGIGTGGTDSSPPPETGPPPSPAPQTCPASPTTPPSTGGAPQTCQASNDPCSDSQSQSRARYIESNEGWRNDVYVDSQGHPTVGIGHMIPAGQSIGSMDDATVRQTFSQDYSRAVSDAQGAASRHGVDFGSLSPARQTVLVDMAFNMGTNPNAPLQSQQGLDGFTNMWSAIHSGDWQRAGQEVHGAGYQGSRADRNAEIMANNDQNAIDQQAARDPRSGDICK